MLSREDISDDLSAINNHRVICVLFLSNCLVEMCNKLTSQLHIRIIFQLQSRFTLVGESFWYTLCRKCPDYSSNLVLMGLSTTNIKQGATGLVISHISTLLHSSTSITTLPGHQFSLQHKPFLLCNSVCIQCEVATVKSRM